MSRRREGHTHESNDGGKGRAATEGGDAAEARSKVERRSARDRRRHPRHPGSSLGGQLRHGESVDILDISSVGLRLETSQRLLLRRTYDLSLDGSHNPMELSGMVVWCRLHSTRKGTHGDVLPVYRAGLELEGAVTGDLKASFIAG